MAMIGLFVPKSSLIHKVFIEIFLSWIISRGNFYGWVTLVSFTLSVYLRQEPPSQLEMIVNPFGCLIRSYTPGQVYGMVKPVHDLGQDLDACFDIAQIGSLDG